LTEETLELPRRLEHAKDMSSDFRGFQSMVMDYDVHQRRLHGTAPEEALPAKFGNKWLLAQITLPWGLIRDLVMFSF
jgi:hypothetical protein